MKLVDGGSLAGRVPGLVRDRGRPPRPGRRRWPGPSTTPTGRGIVHRDLKPANVLLDGGRHARRSPTSGWPSGPAADGGLTRTGAVLGTPSYMAPEQARGEQGRSARRPTCTPSGRSCTSCSTGRPPFRGPTALDTILAGAGRGPGPPPDGRTRRPTADLSRVALKCLEKDPGKRYPSAAALADDLDRWLAGEPVSAARPPCRPAGPGVGPAGAGAGLSAGHARAVRRRRPPEVPARPGGRARPPRPNHGHPRGVGGGVGRVPGPAPAGLVRRAGWRRPGWRPTRPS